MAAAREPKPNRKVLLEPVKGSNFIIEIPADARLTFGQVHPGGKGGYADASNGYYLRVYTTLSNQIAAYNGIVRFRDLTITEVKDEVEVASALGIAKAKAAVKPVAPVDELAEAVARMRQQIDTYLPGPYIGQAGDEEKGY